MLTLVSGFLPADSAKIHFFSQSMLIWNIISSFKVYKECLHKNIKQSIGGLTKSAGTEVLLPALCDYLTCSVRRKKRFLKIIQGIPRFEICFIL